MLLWTVSTPVSRLLGVAAVLHVLTALRMRYSLGPSRRSVECCANASTLVAIVVAIVVVVVVAVGGVEDFLEVLVRPKYGRAFAGIAEK